MNLPPTHQHQGQTATGDKLKWERGLMHDPVEKYTPGRAHDGTIHVWIHPSVVGNSFGGKLFVDGSLLCKYGSQGGQAGWAVTQIHETSHELVCSAHGAMPISLPVQRRILRAEWWALWQAIILSEPGATFVSGCATVPRGLERGSKWCTAARRPHADVWEGTASVTLVTKPMLILWRSARHTCLKRSEPSWTRLVAFWRLAASGQTSWPKRGARDDSFQSILYDTQGELSKRARKSVTLAASFSQAKGGERWPGVTAPPQGWDEKDERWKRAKPILAQPHVLRCSGRQWFCEVYDKRASGGAAKSKLARTECIGHPATALETTMSPLGADWQLCVVLQVWSREAAKFAKKLGEPCVGHPRSQEYARSIRLLSSGWHPKENRYLGSPKLFTKQAWARWRQSYQGGHLRQGWDNGAQASSKFGSARQMRNRRIPMTRNTCSSRQVKSSGAGSVGARVERDSAPRLLLKTACSGAPRTKEHERAFSLLGKGQHPRSSVFVGLPSPISDKEWDQWHQDHGNLFFCLRELSSS